MLAMKIMSSGSLFVDPGATMPGACDRLDQWISSSQSLIDVQLYSLSFIEKLIDALPESTERANRYAMHKNRANDAE